MKKISLIFLLTTISLFVFAQNEYKYTIDLNTVSKDMIKVSCTPPPLSGESATFVVPVVVPGTYDYSYFGQFLKKLTFYDKNGNKIKYAIDSKKNFVIQNPSQIDHFEYWVNDTWDAKLSDDDYIFKPGGTSIEPKTFVLNTFGVFGYFEGMKDLPFQVNVLKPSDIIGTSALQIENVSATQDHIECPNFFELSDNPILYAAPDTSSFVVGNMRVKIGCYSVHGMVTAAQISGYLKPLGESLEKFFGKLPVNEYTFLFYFDDFQQKKPSNKKSYMMAYGALEHHRSSLYYLPEIDAESIVKKTVFDVCGHEFLHILTPLNLHSTYISDFDFRDPGMSVHLWMYEGVTEYFAVLSQEQSGLKTEQDMIDEMREKLFQSDDYPVFSMTEMSKNVLEKPNADYYPTVYTRGALLAMGLDIEIVRLTDGKESLKTIMLKLKDKYGPQKPFIDENLFQDFDKLVSPDLQNYFDAYIVGSERLDYKKYFGYLGYDFEDEADISVNYFGRFGLIYNSKAKAFEISDVQDAQIDLRKGDVLLSVDGEVISFDNIQKVYESYFSQNTEHEAASFVVLRGEQKTSVNGSAVEGIKKAKNVITKANDLSDEQKMIRKVVLEGKLN